MQLKKKKIDSSCCNKVLSVESGSFQLLYMYGGRTVTLDLALKTQPELKKGINGIETLIF